MQCGIFDWPAFLSQAVPPKSSISAEIRVMRLALLHVFYRYLRMRCGIIPAKVDTLVHFAKDRVAFLGRNRGRRHCSNQRGIRCSASFAGARRQRLRNRLRPNDLGWAPQHCSTQRGILRPASLANARRQRLGNRLRPNDLGRSRQHCSTQRGIPGGASLAVARRQRLRDRLCPADLGILRGASLAVARRQPLRNRLRPNDLGRLHITGCRTPRWEGAKRRLTSRAWQLCLSREWRGIGTGVRKDTGMRGFDFNAPIADAGTSRHSFAGIEQKRKRRCQK